MPYLRLYCPELPVKQKKIIAKELTAAAVRFFNPSKDVKNRCIVQFVPFNPEDVAMNGKLISEGGDPDYYLDVVGQRFSDEKKQAFARAVNPMLVRVLNLKSRSWLARLLRVTDPPLFRINILFTEYSPNNFAVGGRLLSEIEGRDSAASTAA